MLNIELINLLQRITGISAFALITLQIFLSTNRKFTKLHMLNGILAYIFIFMHPILMVIYRYLYNSQIDPFYVYVDLCVLCDGPYEFYLNLGRVSFWTITLTVITARLRGNMAFITGKKVGEWIGNNWRKLHLLNYVAFYTVSFHSYNIGTDSVNNLFIYFFWFCQTVVIYSIGKKILEFKRS